MTTAGTSPIYPSRNFPSCPWTVDTGNPGIDVYKRQGLGVTSTGRYPASCPVKPGLSSSATFRHLQPRPSVLLCVSVSNYITDYSMCQFPDLSTSFRNPLPLSPARHTAHSADVRHGPSPSGTSPDGSLSLSEAVSTGRYS